MFKPYPSLPQPTKVGFNTPSSLIVFDMPMKLAMMPQRFTSHRIAGITVRAAIVLMLAGFSVLPVCASDNSAMSPTSGTASLLEPKTFSAWVKRGVELTKANDLDGAIAAFNRALALKLDYADAYFYRGTAYAQTGNARAALADFSQVILLKPNNASARYTRGSLRAAVGDRPGAIADFQQAAKLFKQQLNVPWQQKALDNVKALQQP